MTYYWGADRDAVVRILNLGVTVDHVMSSAIPAEKVETAGVYILLNAGKLSYIGQSVNVAKRVKGHALNGRVFTDAVALAMPDDPEDVRLFVEAYLISVSRPPSNRRVRGLNDLASHTLNRLQCEDLTCAIVDIYTRGAATLRRLAAEQGA